MNISIADLIAQPAHIGTVAPRMKDLEAVVLKPLSLLDKAESDQSLEPIPTPEVKALKLSHHKVAQLDKPQVQCIQVVNQQ